jgi:hypothetical protein
MRAQHAGPESISTSRGYGFSDVQLHIKARRFAAPRNDEINFQLSFFIAALIDEAASS